MGPGLEPLPVIHSCCFPLPQTEDAEPALQGLQSSLASHPWHCDTTAALRSEWGPALKAESRGQLTGLVTLGELSGLIVLIYKTRIKMPTWR